LYKFKIMDKKEIDILLREVTIPIYQIEENLGMPKTTLQKAIKGDRVLPKKWALKLKELFPIKKEIVINELNEQANKVEPQKPLGTEKSNFTINTTIPPMPQKSDFKDSYEFAAAKSEWKLKYNQ